MAANVKGMRVEGTAVAGAAEKRGGAHGKRIGIAVLLAAILAAVLIGGTVMHERGASHPALSTIPGVISGAETRFPEQNTITPPDAGVAESRPAVVSSEEQRYLDENTTWIPVVASPVMTMEQQKYLEVNTIMPVAAPASYMEQLTPPPGQPR